MPIWLLTIGTRLLGLRSVIGKGFAWLDASSTHLLIGLCGIITFFAAWEYHEAHRWHDKADACAQGRKDDRAAAQKALAEAHAKSKQVAETSDVRHTDQLAADLAAGDDYKRAHRVRWQPPAPVQGDAAPVAPQPAPTTDMVAVSPPDFDACTADYAYSLSAYQWGQDMIAKGLAQ